MYINMHHFQGRIYLKKDLAKKKSQFAHLMKMDFSEPSHSKHHISAKSLRESLACMDSAHPSLDSKYEIRMYGVPLRSFIFGSVLLLFLLFGRVLSVLSFIFLSTEWFLVITTSLCALEYWLHEPSSLSGSGVVCARPLTKMQDRVCSALSQYSIYEPPWWHFGTHSTTLFPVMVHKPPPKRVITQPVIAADGSTLFLEWFIPDEVSEIRGVILAIAGMNGSSAGGYMVDLMERVGKEGYSVAVLSGRGTGKTKIEKIESTFHMGRSEDLMCALEKVEEVIQRQEVPVFILGFSAGGVRAVNFASVYGETLVGRVAGVISFGGAVKNDKTLSMRLSKFVYQPVMVHAYACTLYNKLLPLLDGPDGTHIKELFTSKGFESFYDYDKNITSRLHNLTIKEYHTLSMPIFSGLWQRISVPTLIVHACDDPVLHVDDSIVPEMAMGNSFVTLLSTRKGGHIGWPTKERGYQWMMDVAYTYISQIDQKR